MTKLEFVSHVVSVAIIFYPLYVYSLAMNSEDGRNTTQLALIGSIEGKSYYAEDSHVEHWVSAKWFCESNGMRLGTVTSIPQLTLLINAYNNITFTGLYWTGARNLLTVSEFSWAHNDEVLNSAVISPYFVLDGHACISFRPNDKYFHAEPCELERKILCELVL